MRMPEQEPFLNIEHAANALSEILAKLPFEPRLKAELDQLQMRLVDGNLSAQHYFNNEHVNAAIETIKRNNQHFLPAALRLWWQQSHHFGSNGKTLLMLSSIFLLAGAILSHEAFTVFFDGKPRLEETGSAIQGYCTSQLTGFINKIVGICTTLENGATAVFNIHGKIDVLPNFVGFINDSLQVLAPGATFQSISTWFNPIAWINFFTCKLQDTAILMTGHTFSGSLMRAQQRAANGFPVIFSNITTIPDPLLGNTTGFAINVFMGMFCLLIQNGGYSVMNDLQNKPYGNFDGFERFGYDYRFYARTAGAVYFGIVLASFFVMAALQYIKALSKWELSSDARVAISLGKTACAVFAKFEPVQVDTRSEVSLERAS